MGDGIHVLGIHGVPCTTRCRGERGTLVIFTAGKKRSVMVERLGPAVGVVFTELETSFEGITVPLKGSRTLPTKRPIRSKAGRIPARCNDKTLGHGRVRGSLRHPDRATRHHEQHQTRNNHHHAQEPHGCLRTRRLRRTVIHRHRRR